MTHLHWDTESGTLRFQLDTISGVILADGNHQRTTELVYRPSGLHIGDVLLAPYRILARSQWMGELRSMPHRAEPTDHGVRVIWDARLAHQAQVVIEYAVREPNMIDVDVLVTGHHPYPSYELLFSSYFSPGFLGGAYVKATKGDGLEQVHPSHHPVYEEMYISFPRDEAAAHAITDGRWQRGRHWTRFLPARYYALPMGYFHHSQEGVDVLVMGVPRDVFAVSMAYAGDQKHDSVAAHNSLYLHLFNADLQAGEAKRTRLRLAVTPSARDGDQHLEVFQQFSREASSLDRSPNVDFDALPGLR